MQELYYSALDIAAIVSGMDMTCRAESKVLDLIWKWEKEFLPLEYRNHQRKYILDVRYWMNYFYEKPILDSEFPAIEKDFLVRNGELSRDKFISDFGDLDLFFKSIRLRTMYALVDSSISL